MTWKIISVQRQMWGFKISTTARPASFFCVHLEGVSPTDADCNWKILKAVKPFFDVCKRGWILIDEDGDLCPIFRIHGHDGAPQLADCRHLAEEIYNPFLFPLHAHRVWVENRWLLLGSITYDKEYLYHFCGPRRYKRNQRLLQEVPLESFVLVMLCATLMLKRC